MVSLDKGARPLSRIFGAANNPHHALRGDYDAPPFFISFSIKTVILFQLAGHDNMAKNGTSPVF